MFTEHRMLKHNGDTAQWKGWRYKGMSWPAHVNPAFETLTTKLNARTQEPEPSQANENMSIEHEVAIEEEEWCS